MRHPMLHCRTLVSYRLRLQDCASTTIGSSLARGISGGGEGGARALAAVGRRSPLYALSALFSCRIKT